MILLVGLLLGILCGLLASSWRRQSSDDLDGVKSSLEKFEAKISELERGRIEGQATLKEQMSSLLGVQRQLQQETDRLSSSLRATNVRGRWGEVQLRRVVELAGMVSHCDFFEQHTEGGRRPDMVVRLPAGRHIVVDAKAPLDAYLRANESGDEEVRGEWLRKHAEQVRSHMKQLARRDYSSLFQPAPEFVVLFLPGEVFFSAALSGDPTLIEAGAEQGIILATPTTLISLLKSVAFGWRQESLAKNVEEMGKAGQELLKRLSTLSSHWNRVGKSLGAAVGAYNDAIGSYERRVLPKARELEQLSGKEETLPALEPIENSK